MLKLEVMFVFINIEPFNNIVYHIVLLDRRMQSWRNSLFN